MVITLEVELLVDTGVGLINSSRREIKAPEPLRAFAMLLVGMDIVAVASGFNRCCRCGAVREGREIRMLIEDDASQRQRPS